MGSYSRGEVEFYISYSIGKWELMAKEQDGGSANGKLVGGKQ